MSNKIITVRPDKTTTTLQQLPNFVGVSEQTAGSNNISMNMVIIPPGAKAEPHMHKDFETAIYLLKGKVKTLYGPGLRESVINETGDFVYIPAGVPHQPINLSDTETAQAIVARNDANEQESVVAYDPLSEQITNIK